MGPACSGRYFCGSWGGRMRELNSRQGWPHSGQHPDLLTHRGRAQGASPEVSVCPLSLCFGSPYFRGLQPVALLLGFSHSLALFSCCCCCRCPVSNVPRPSSHDFSFCLSDSLKQKHTSKAPQRGSSLDFSDLWFSCPFPLFPCSSCLSHFL